MKAIDFLESHVREESLRDFGKISEKNLKEIVTAWMDDESNSGARFNVIENYSPGSRTILDLASGCGTFVFGGALRGHRVFGLEPESWKNRFNQMKAREKGYPEVWGSRFIRGTGEQLPFADNSFDVVSTYQTLEHVKDLEHCLEEMLRVVKPGGGLQIQCPDYRSTYEGHYQLPWLPLFPRGLARVYLKIMGRPASGLESINYTTPDRIEKALKKCSRRLGKSVEIQDVNHKAFEKKMKEKNIPLMPGTYSFFALFQAARNLFRAESQIHYWVRIT